MTYLFKVSADLFYVTVHREIAEETSQLASKETDGQTYKKPTYKQKLTDSVFKETSYVKDMHIFQP